MSRLVVISDPAEGLIDSPAYRDWYHRRFPKEFLRNEDYAAYREAWRQEEPFYFEIFYTYLHSIPATIFEPPLMFINLSDKVTYRQYRQAT